MRVVLFTHSLYSEWNHGSAHFLRGIASELMSRGVDVRVFEPVNASSFANMLADAGVDAIDNFRRAYPGLTSIQYHPESLDLDEALGEASLVLVHERTDTALVRRIGKHRKRGGSYQLLFHDTNHRALSDRESMAAYDLRHFDGVLAVGKAIRDVYLAQGWARRAWTWHEAADTRIFCPAPSTEKEGDLVWIGNWGDDERSDELKEFLIRPVRALGLRARVYGARYPERALRSLEKAGIEYGGWLPNYEAPAVFGRYRVTVHVPRRPFAAAVPGVPAIHMFEALACGIPLISAPWEDTEQMFRTGVDYLQAADGRQMRDRLERVLSDARLAEDTACHGLQTVTTRHTCRHRANELLSIYESLEEERGSLLPVPDAGASPEADD